MKKPIPVLLIAVMVSLCASCATTGGKGGPLPLKVMSFNLLVDNMGYRYPWAVRREPAAALIREEQIDIIGTQELLEYQINGLLELLPDYAFVGAGRLDGERADQFDSAILYRSSRFRLVKSASFWLSETPEKPGKRGWDAHSPRMATWAILQDKATGKRIFCINTHLDHIGQTARVEGAKLIMQRIAARSRGLPVILTGDFNATPDNEAVRAVLDPANPVPLLHSRDIAAAVEGPAGSNRAGTRLIDYVFVSPAVRVNRCRVMPLEREGIELSDHHAVLAELAAE